MGIRVATRGIALAVCMFVSFAGADPEGSCPKKYASDDGYKPVSKRAGIEVQAKRFWFGKDLNNEFQICGKVTNHNNRTVKVRMKLRALCDDGTETFSKEEEIDLEAGQSYGGGGFMNAPFCFTACPACVFPYRIDAIGELVDVPGSDGATGSGSDISAGNDTADGSTTDQRVQQPPVGGGTVRRVPPSGTGDRDGGDGGDGTASIDGDGDTSGSETGGGTTPRTTTGTGTGGGTSHGDFAKGVATAGALGLPLFLGAASINVGNGPLARQIRFTFDFFSNNIMPDGNGLNVGIGLGYSHFIRPGGDSPLAPKAVELGANVATAFGTYTTGLLEARSRAWFGPAALYVVADLRGYKFRGDNGDYQTRRTTAGPGIAVGVGGNTAWQLIASAQVTPMFDGGGSYALTLEAEVGKLVLVLGYRRVDSSEEFGLVQDGTLLHFAFGFRWPTAVPTSAPKAVAQ